MPFTPNRRTTLRSAGLFALASAIGAPSGPIPANRKVAAQDSAPLAVALLDSHSERLESLVETYAENLGVEIDVTPLEYGELYSQLSLALTQRSPKFDVVSLDDPWIPQFASFLLPVDGGTGLTDQVVPIASALARFPADAPPCGLPWLGDSQFFVTRPAWLESDGLAEPASWDETVESASSIAATLTSEEELAGFAISMLTPHQIVDSFLPILRGCGKDLIDPDTSVPQLDTPEALEAVAFFQQLAALSPIESAATGAPSNIEHFETGSVAMMSDFWASALLAAGEVETAPSAGPIRCAMQPSQRAIERRSMSSVWIAAIPTGSERPERARAFVEWLTTETTQRAMVGVALPPVMASIYGDEALTDSQPHLTQLLELLAGSTPRPRSPYYPQLELLLATELASMLKGEQSGDDAVRRANIAMREFLVREGVLES